MAVSYESDNIYSIYNEFVELENEIDTVGRNIKTLAYVAVSANAEYENAKNQTLLLLYAEECGDEERGIKPFKRTEVQREAIYRTQHRELREQRGFADADLKSEQDLLRALLAKLSGMQSRKTILMAETSFKATGGI